MPGFYRSLPLVVFGVGLAFSLPTHAAQIIPGHIPAAVTKLKALGAFTSNQSLKLSVGLPMRNQDQLTVLLKELYDPGSPLFHHFITPAEFTARFGPTQADYDALKIFAKNQGFRISGEHPNRMVLDIEGDVPTIEKSLHVRMQLFQHPTQQRTFYAPSTEPSLDLSVPVLHISGLDNYDPPRPLYKARTTGGSVQPAATPRSGSASGGGYAGNDFRNAYVPGSSLTGTGQTVGLLEFDGYYTNDITTYETSFGRANIPLINVPVDGGISTPGSANVEVALDIEMVISIAPNLAGVYIYEAPNSNGEWDSILSRMANDNLAKQLSCSWGGGGPDATAEQIFQQMAAQGQSFFVASGDSDAYTGAVPFPSDSPSITVVGGTTLTTSSAGGPYASETVWNWGYDSAARSYVGSSGGISTSYTIPSYQQGVSMTANKGSTTMRNLPDVAMTADNVFVNADNGGSVSVGGTSCAAPLWAGFMALANQQALAGGHSTAGFINPAIYTIGRGSNSGTMLHDITTGNNFSSSSPSKFAATSGYDLCTGWGSPVGSALINQLVGTGSSSGAPTIVSPTQVIAYYNQSFGYEIAATGSPTGFTASNLPTGLSIDTNTGFISGAPTVQGTFSVSITASNSSGTGSATLSITVQSTSVPQITSTLTASATSGVYFGYQIYATGNPSSFAASGLPSGLSIDTTAGEISGTPTVTGTYNVTISATNSNGTGSAVLVLTVSPSTAPVITAPLVNLDTFPTYTGVAQPEAGLILGSDGNYYGVSTQGGNLWGTVYKMTPAGVITILHTFTGSGTDGKSPFGTRLVQGQDGNFYGVTSAGGSYGDGVVFKITPQGAYTTIFSFNGTNGNYPERTLTLGSDGNFYGSTVFGGSANYGTLFKITPQGVLTTLVNFTGSSNGSNPNTNLLLAADGNFYGGASTGGAYGYGTLFKVTSSGSLTTLYNFSATDALVPNSLMQTADGTIYGTLNQGGIGSYGGCGAIFKMSTAGAISVLHYFTGGDGINPDGPLILGADGNFYGVTSYGGNPSNVPGGNNVGNGTVFKMTPTGNITTLTAFTYANGRVPTGTLIPDGQGNFIGTSYIGGSGGTSGNGTIYKITPFFANLSVGSTYSYQITATGNPTGFNATGLPTGLSVNTSTGLISGAPTQAGVFNVTLSASNPSGAGYATLTITVQGPPAITNAPLIATTTINTPFTFSYAITGYPTPTVSLTAGALPASLTLSSVGVISGTPTQTGAFTGTITASNGIGTPATQNFSITVVQPPVILNAPLSGNLTVGASAGFNYLASGYPPPTFLLKSGTLPPGLSLSSAGLLSGTPTAAGSYSGIIDATNGINPDATQAFNLTVQDTLATWEAGYFNSTQLNNPAVSGLNANPMDDGVPNLLKYLFDISPLVNINANNGSMLPQPEIITYNSATYLVLNFRQNPLAGGITVNLQTSPDMRTWTTVTPDLNRTIGTDPVTGDSIKQLGVKLTGASAVYIRLNVTSP